jgi:hypothetical protein
MTEWEHKSCQRMKRVVRNQLGETLEQILPLNPRRNPCCEHFDFGYLHSCVLKNESLCFKSPVQWYFIYVNPRKIIQTPNKTKWQKLLIERQFQYKSILRDFQSYGYHCLFRWWLKLVSNSSWLLLSVHWKTNLMVITSVTKCI